MNLLKKVFDLLAYRCNLVVNLVLYYSFRCKISLGRVHCVAGILRGSLCIGELMVDCNLGRHSYCWNLRFGIPYRLVRGCVLKIPNALFGVLGAWR